MKLRYLFCFGILEICLMLSGAMAFVNASSDPIFAADELYAKRSNPENVRQAMNLLKQAVTLTPDNSEALWRLAKYQWFLGNQCTHKKTKLTFFSQGQEYARKAVKANCNDINAHFWLAALIGASGQATGNLQSLSSVAPMKKEIDICFQINPEFADAHDMLAQLYWMAPGPPLSIGNKKRSCYFLQQPGHIPPQCLERFDSFLILLDVAGVAGHRHIPVIGAGNDHLGDPKKEIDGGVDEIRASPAH